MDRIEITVGGMSCGGCENAVRAAVAKLPHIDEVSADHATGNVVITADGPVDLEEIRAAIGRAGYTVLF